MESKRNEGACSHKRIVVVGTTGCGKSTFGAHLSRKLGLEFVELDALNWGPDWAAAGPELLRVRAERATRAPGWVVAGNYSATRPVTWARAETVVWLDYALPVILARLLARTFRRLWTREVLWNGNQERLSSQLKLWSEEALVHWLFKTYWRRRREYPLLFALPEHAHLAVLRFRTPAEAQAWLADL